jgi:hypothetical protein
MTGNRISLQKQVDTLAWLHAELTNDLDQFVTKVVVPQQEQIKTLAWLHTELVCQLKAVLAQQQALVARAKAVRLAQANAAKTMTGAR